jgi:hypothetical protein
MKPCRECLILSLPRPVPGYSVCTIPDRHTDFRISPPNENTTPAYLVTSCFVQTTSAQPTFLLRSASSPHRRPIVHGRADILIQATMQDKDGFTRSVEFFEAE